MNGEEIVTIARQWRAYRDGAVRTQRVSEAGAGAPADHMAFMRTHEEFAARMLDALPAMTPEDFAAFSEVCGGIPHVMAQRGKAFRKH